MPIDPRIKRCLLPFWRFLLAMRVRVGHIPNHLRDTLRWRWQMCLYRLRNLPHRRGTAPANAALSPTTTQALRSWVQHAAGLPATPHGEETMADLLTELRFLRTRAAQLQPLFKSLTGRRVLYAGQAYYNAWYLARALRERGWKADLLNWDLNESSQIYYHGEDIRFTMENPYPVVRDLRIYVAALYDYDVFHFSNTQGICFGFPLQSLFERHWGKHAEVHLLKQLGKKIVYSNNGCQDGVSQTAFAQWGPESICAICPWLHRPDVCSDTRNLSWGKFRNEVADYQCLLGGNRVDYNLAPTVHESPEFYCLNPQVWDPELPIPAELFLPKATPDTLRVYHAVGHKKERTSEDGINIKSSHIYLPLIEKLQAEGIPLELIAPTGIPNMQVRFLQMQADIFLEMLTFGWFGANAREAMMLGKPVICYIRPEWLESLRREIPEYADTLPIISATPHTVEAILRDLIANPQKRREIGERSRAFALKWHSMDAAGKRFDEIYTKLLSGDPLWVQHYA
ncbi:MAG: glycosyltransferase [Pseudomonadota bacterium]